MTTVSNGTLQVNGSIASGVTVKTGGAIGGTGAIAGSVAIEAGGALAPGASVGALSVVGNLTLAGNLWIEVDKALSPSNDFTSVVGTLVNTGAGVIAVTNLNPGVPLAVGDRFTLFSKPVTGGALLTPAPPPGPGLAWTNQLALDGSIAVIPGTAAYPTNLTYSVSGNTLTITWPATHLGWILQSQTNSLSIGIANNWVDVAGSQDVTQESMPINPANPAVFYRLRMP
jgi:uncharacterized protein with beta-barrel porin domain